LRCDYCKEGFELSTNNDKCIDMSCHLGMFYHPYKQKCKKCYVNYCKTCMFNENKDRDVC
jgi:hypothetical protein